MDNNVVGLKEDQARIINLRLLLARLRRTRSCCFVLSKVFLPIYEI